MRKNKANTIIGLSREEFYLIIENSNNPALVEQYIYKLDNCDLSRSAIELINEEDLSAVNRITENNLLNYPVVSNKKRLNKIFIFCISLATLFVGFFLLNNRKTKSLFTQRREIKSDTLKVKKDIYKKQETKTYDPREEELSPFQIIDSSNKKHIVPESSSKSILKSASKASIKTLGSKKSDFTRKVRQIKSIKKVPEKYRKTNYFKTDLVCFFGGENNLDQTLLEKFKGKIKDTHVPQNNNSIVFKFSVSSKGKISAIDIQSNVTLELEQIIRKHTLELSNWIKGNKAITVIYTVYITYN